MKHTFVVALIMVLLIGCGGDQTGTQVQQTGGVLTASWEDSRDTVQAKFAVEGLQLVTDSIDLVYSGGSYEGYAVEQWVLSFGASGTLQAATITFAPDTAGSVGLAQALDSRFSGKYGPASEPMTWVVKGEAGTTGTKISIAATEGGPVVLSLQAVAAEPAAEETRTESPVTE